MAEIITVIAVWAVAVLGCSTVAAIQKAAADYDRRVYDQHFIDVRNGVKP